MQDGKDLPYVFILDLDGTIVGSVEFQVSRYSLIQTLKKHGLKAPAQKEVPEAYYREELLIRPGFLECIQTLKSNFQWCHIFIYTASEKKWANHEIQWIEKSLGISFEKPIFTRSDCVIQANGSIRKSLRKILPRIFRTLSRQKNLTPHEKEYIIKNQLMIIDDNSVYLDAQERILLCASYNYLYCENILEGIDNQSLSHPSIREEYTGLVKEGLVHPHAYDEGKDHHTKKASIHLWMAEKCKMVFQRNQPYHKDVFWKKLRHIIIKNNIIRFSSQIIHQLQNLMYPKK